MANGQLRTVVRQLNRMLNRPDPGDPPDRQLLERFAASRDEEAFATLVRRHGPLVWGVCWRMLRHIQDAEDCFQATFVVLARRAGSVPWKDAVANWLYGVARRVAAEAKGKRARQQSRERQVVVLPERKPMPEVATRELCTALDEELNRLPETYRVALLLCYLEGRTADQAARQLGWSLRTLERRLAQGRERLRDRLARRGLTLSGVLLAGALSGEATQAAVPAGVASAAIRTATFLAAEPSGAVLALAEAASRGIAMTKLKVAAMVLLLLSATVGPGVLLVSTAMPQAEAAGPIAPAAEATPAGKEDEDRPGESRQDLARRMWAILNVVEKNHAQPPPRQEIILKGAQALLKRANTAAPRDLDRRAAAVHSEDQLRTFLQEIWPKERAAEGTTSGTLETALLDGLFDGIPGRPHLQHQATVELQERLRGNRYVGVGVQLAANDKEKLPQIAVPFRRGAARKAGCLPDDLLLEIDGKSMHGLLDLEKVATMLRGAEGTTLTIVVRQPGAAQTRSLHLTRAVVPLDSLFGFRPAGEEAWDYCLDPEARIAYVWVKSLKASTRHELAQLEGRLHADGMRGLVLDFRFSQGDGHLHDAALVADGLIDGGLMWTVREPHFAVKEWWADRECLFRDWPMVALVSNVQDNAQGAVLAALQDRRRATLVGEPAEADGAIRRVFPLPCEQGVITVLTGQLERAERTRGWPVCPDRVVELSKEQRAAVEKWLMDKQLPVLPPGTDDRPPQDPQLAAGVAVLRDRLSTAVPQAKQEPERGK